MYLSVFQNERSPNNGAANTPVESNWTHRNTQRSLECFNCKWNMKKKEKKPCILIDCYQYCLLLAFKDPLFFALFSSTLFFSRLKFSDINIGVKNWRLHSPTLIDRKFLKIGVASNKINSFLSINPVFCLFWTEVHWIKIRAGCKPRDSDLILLGVNYFDTRNRYLTCNIPMTDKIWIRDRVKSLISLNFPSIFLSFFSSFFYLFIATTVPVLSAFTQRGKPYIIYYVLVNLEGVVVGGGGPRVPDLRE